MDKVYIVVNKEQELEVLKKLEQKGLVWDDGEKPTEWLPSEKAFGLYTLDFPYALTSRNDEYIIWFPIEELEDEMVVYDGRKEDEEVGTRYKVTKEFMNELVEWRDHEDIDATNGKIYAYVGPVDIDEMPSVVSNWWQADKNPIERNNRLIAIIQWLNGEDVFDVEKPHQFVVRNDTPNGYEEYYYVLVYNGITDRVFSYHTATKFDTREEAQEWANSHQVVVEINEEGNEMEE